MLQKKQNPLHAHSSRLELNIYNKTFSTRNVYILVINAYESNIIMFSEDMSECVREKCI